ncbi:MAG: FliA/WhiG family RNA polymerase sigma factor [Acidobacteriota bacterium]
METFAPAPATQFTPEEREELILQSMPLVYSIARRLIGALPPDISIEDLVSAGTVGLIRAVDNFDTAVDVKLATYAAHRIRGAMLDNVRASDWVPRRQRAHLKRLQDGMASAQAKYQRFTVSDEEVAVELGVSPEEYRETLASVSVTRVVSLEESVSDGENHLDHSSVEAPSEALERAQMAGLLELAVDRLSKEEQIVLSLYYQEEMSPQEIARIMKLPVKRVYQVKAQSILRLRTALDRKLLRKVKS